MELTKDKVHGAVSPVVGVILMVAVTVILAAVIGTFVLDLGNNVQENPQAGVTFEEDGSEDTVSAQIISMENADEVRVSPDADGTFSDTAANCDGTLSDGDCILDSVGQSATVKLTGDSTVSVIGELDGKEAVLQTYDYDF